MSDKIVYAQMHCHSRSSINPLSGEGVFHQFVWPLERQIMKLVMRSPRGLMKLAARKGVNYVAITDHNRIPIITGDSDFTITGEEWGQSRGHSNFIDLEESIEPECGYFETIRPVKPKDFPTAAAEARKQGAFVSINHPFKSDSWEWGTESYGLADALEIWNGEWGEANEKALELWQSLLVNGLRIWCMAGNDFHVNHLFNIDSQVLAFDDVSTKFSLVAKLKNGKYSVARDTRSPVVFLGDDLRYRIEKYVDTLELRSVSSHLSETVDNPGREGSLDRSKLRDFVRLELWEGNDPLSFSNPVFL